jgi:four helix bundle protein
MKERSKKNQADEAQANDGRAAEQGSGQAEATDPRFARARPGITLAGPLQPPGQRFIAYDLALELAGQIKTPLAGIRKHDRDLYRQVRRAMQSCVLNLAEGARRRGQDRIQLYRISAGSLAEVLAAFQLACVWDYLHAADAAFVIRGCDRLLGMLHVLTDKRSQAAA